MHPHLVKMIYPNLNYDERYGVWKEKESFQCHKHGSQECSVDTAMVIEGGGCIETRIKDPYCPSCRDEEQARIAEEKRKLELEERQREIIENQRKSRLRNMGIPYRFQNTTFENFTATTPKQKAALKACRAFAENFKTLHEEKGGLVLMGKVGTGKTHLSIAMGVELLSQDLSVRYLTIGRLIREVRESWGDRTKSEEKIYASLSSHFDLLIIDEIGVQNCTDNERNILFEVINGRYEERRPTVLVSNLNPTVLTSMVGQRVMDRIAEGGGNRIVFDWDSYRQRAA